MKRIEVAKAFVVDRDGKILLLRRSGTHPRFALHYDLPGGEVEHGEEAVSGVVREVLEETGLVVAVDAVRLVHEEPSPNKPNHYLLYEVRVPSARPQVAISWEHDTAEWLAPHEIIAYGHYGPDYDSYYTMAIRQLQAKYLTSAEK